MRVIICFLSLILMPFIGFSQDVWTYKNIKHCNPELVECEVKTQKSHGWRMVGSRADDKDSKCRIITYTKLTYSNRKKSSKVYRYYK